MAENKMEITKKMNETIFNDSNDHDNEIINKKTEDTERVAPYPQQVFTSEGCISTKLRRKKQLIKNSFPSSYKSNSNKEMICLEYCRDFLRQYEALYPARNTLFIEPLNECDFPKLVCTTIRPTELPYRELYDADKCAEFISNIIDYEPLEHPSVYPSYLPSSSTVLSWCIGDCFDLATLLTSCLCGAGYDAYVVSGYAPKWICLKDQSKLLRPLLNREKDETETTTRIQQIQIVNHKSNYTIKERGEMKSKYLQEEEKKVEEQRRASLIQQDDDEYSEDNEDKEEDASIGKKRIHAWVLIRAGKREVSDHFFIEPSTGRSYPVRKSPYYGIESLWNHHNYWVNMQKEVDLISHQYDLSNTNDWEYVFIDPLLNAKRSNEGKELFGEDKQNEQIDNILDLPPSWVNKIVIEKELYIKNFLNQGQRTILYHKATMEKFAVGVHEQGIISRLTLFRDVQRTLPVEYKEYFKNRHDKLDYRIRLPLQGKIHEHFLPGRVPEGLKDRIEWTGVKRELVFYTSARVDGLIRREEIINKKIIEIYEGREDNLIFRSVTLADNKEIANGIKSPYTISGSSSADLTVQKMKEKFSRDETKEADHDISKITYNVSDGIIHVQYHYAPGKITATKRIYNKGSNISIQIIQTDPYAPRIKESILKEDMDKFLQRERDCMSNIRHLESEMQEILKIRKKEETSITIDQTLFDAARESAKKGYQESKDEIKELKENIQTDYLAAYLPPGSSQLLKLEEAQKIRDSCLKALKERLLERASVIQRRLDEENNELAKKQATFQRSQREVQAGDDEFEKFCSDAMFRIQILEQRLARHEEAALQKYAELDNKLHNDPRLAILNT